LKFKILLLISVITASVVFSSLPNANAAQSVVNGSVVLNGQSLSFDTKPIVANGNTMVPFRQIFESLEMKVDWNAKTKNITASKDNLTIRMTLESFKASVNEKEYTLTQTPFDSPEGMVYVNVRFISEAVGATVSWDNVKKIVTINTK
jgi:hypothetical protein